MTPASDVPPVMEITKLLKYLSKMETKQPPFGANEI
jgi:hypothetical protein